MRTKTPKHVLFVDHTPFAGGAQLVLAEHISELDVRYFKPYIACTNDTPVLLEKYESAGAGVHVIKMPKLRRKSLAVLWHFLVSIWQLRRIIRQQEIDLVVSNTTRSSYIASLAVLGLRVPIIWWVRDYLYPKVLFNLLKGIPVKIIFVSESIKKHYLPDDEQKGEVVYVSNSIYKQLAQITPDLISKERRRWGIRPEDMVVGFMGRLVAEKGAEDVMRAVLEVSKSHPEVKALIVGTGKGQMNNVEQQLHDLAKRDDQHQRIIFTGYQQNEALYYSLFDIFVLSTRDREPFATSVVQAMMAKKPVIGTDAGGTRELVEDRKTGMLVRPHEVASMAQALATLVEDKDLRDKVAKNGHERVLQYHREEVVTDRLEALYSDILRR